MEYTKEYFLDENTAWHGIRVINKARMRQRCVPTYVDVRSGTIVSSF